MQLLSGSGTRPSWTPPLLRGHVLVSACSQVIVERGTDNALQKNSGCVRSAFVDHDACHVGDSFGQLASFVGSRCREGRLQELILPVWELERYLTAVNCLAPQHDQTSVDFDAWDHRFAVLQGHAVSKLCTCFVSSLVRALLRADVRLFQLLLTRFFSPHGEVVRVSQVRCLVLMQSFTTSNSKRKGKQNCCEW